MRTFVSLHLPEAQYRPLSSSEGQVRVLTRLMAQQPISCLSRLLSSFLLRVGAQPVGGDRFGRAVTLECLLYEGQRCLLVARPADKALQDLTFLIDRTLQVTISPFSFTYTSSRCQRQWRNPRMRLTRLRRTSPANIGRNLFHHSRTVSWQMSIPRSNSRSSTLLRRSGKRTYISTTSRITSGEELR